MPADETEEPGTIRRVRMTLDDLRDPKLVARMWGYDREQVDRLFAAVADAVEKLQQRRQRDAAAIEALTNDLAEATARAVEAEERLAALEEELDAAEDAVATADARAAAAEQARAEAEARARAVRPGVSLPAAAEASAGALAALGHLADDDAEPATPAHPVTLGVRAARALVREARARAAEIVADAERQAGSPTSV